MPPQSQSSSDTHMANFRSISPAVPQRTSGTPQTGLGILLNNKNAPVPTAVTSSGYTYSTTSEQISPLHDAPDQEQASALAAAGMVAETVAYSAYVRNGVTSPLDGLGLRAPPMLGSLSPPPNPDPNSAIDGVNWNMMDVGMAIDDIDETIGVIDDMEMDFAKMFDPAQEEAHMEGNGWHGTVNQTTASTGDIAHM